MTIWLQKLAPRPHAKARLFCFPYAGAGAAAYRLWAAEVPGDLEICAVQLPGRGNRLKEPPMTCIREMVDALLEALSPQLNLPFAFFGHSMGSIVAYELARELAEHGMPEPSHLFLSGRRPPNVPDRVAPLRFLNDAEFITAIDRRYGGIPAALLHEPDVLALLLPCLRADIAALELHSPPARSPLGVPMTVYGGRQDPIAPQEHLEAWRSETTGMFRVRTFPGTHFYLDPQRRELLADLVASMSPLLAWEHPVETQT